MGTQLNFNLPIGPPFCNVSWTCYKHQFGERRLASPGCRRLKFVIPELPAATFGPFALRLLSDIALNNVGG
jgi:hypothetical protein